MHWFVNIPYRTNRYTFLASLFGILWFLLVLYPLGHSGMITGFYNFVYVIFAFLVLEWIGFRWYVSGCIKVLVISLFMHTFFYSSTSFLQVDWISQFMLDTQDNVRAILNQEWDAINNSIQTFGLLIGIWIGVRVFARGVRNTLWITILLVAGEVVFSVFRSFLEISCTANLVLYALLGFLFLMFRNYQRLQKWRKEDSDPDDHWRSSTIPNSWFAWFSSLLIVVMAFVLFAPKPTGVWESPFNNQPSTDGGGGIGEGSGKIVLKSGFTDHTETLGGSFIQDQTIAFQVISPDETYYRGDEKSIYTGHGWIGETQQLYHIPSAPYTFLDGGNWDSFKNLKTKTIKQTYQIMSGSYSRFFTAYQVVQALQGGTNNLWNGVTTDYEHGTISGHYLIPGDQYQIVSEEAYDSHDLLMHASATPDYPKSIASEYLQLPPTLPKRVIDLAHQITDSQNSPYAKAQAIVDYLHANYTYETSGIPVPTHNQDFVDQFLFDTKKGYCDHFSSALAVLTRAVGIPSRWITGYAPGTKDQAYTGPDSRYIVRQKDAHAWAEIYINGYGWIPMEATPGFIFPQPFEEQAVSAATSSGTTATTTKPNKTVKQETPADQQDATSKPASSHTSFTVNSWWFYGILLVLLFVGWRFRRAIRYRLVVFRWRNFGKGNPEHERLVRSAKHLLAVAKKRGYVQHEGITFREFADRLSQLYPNTCNDLSTFVSVIERTSYSERQVDADDLRHAWELWNQIVKSLYLTP